MQGTYAPLATERYAANDRITISIRRDDLERVNDLVYFERDSAFGIYDAPDRAQAYAEQLDRILELFEIATRTQ